MKNYTLKVGVLIFSFVVLVLGLGLILSNTAMGQSVETEVIKEKTTTCTFNNTKKGALQIIKNVTGPPSSEFYYSIMPTPLFLRVKANRAIDGEQHKYTSHGRNKNKVLLDEGQYSVLEQVPSDLGWVMKSVSCTILPPGCGDQICNSRIGENCNTCSTDCEICPLGPPRPPPPPTPPPPPPPPPVCDDIGDDTEECQLNELNIDKGKGTRTNNLTDATNDTNEPNIGLFGDKDSVWYKFTSDVDKQVTIDTCGSSIDTVMSLRIDVGENENKFGYEVASDDDSCPFSDGSRITYDITAGTEYYLGIDGYGKIVGPITLAFTEGLPSSSTTPPPPPLSSPDSTGTPISGKYGIKDVDIMLDRTTACTFENELMAIKIVNQAIGGDGTEKFNYKIVGYDRSSPSIIHSKLSLHPDKKVKEDRERGDEYIGSNGRYLKPAVTSYVITEEIPEGWGLNSVVCQLQDGKRTGVPTIYNYGVINVTVEPEKTTTCTFINTKKGELKIIKNAEQAKEGMEFNYDINFISSNYLPQAILSFPLPTKKTTVKVNEEKTEKIYPGVYRVIENFPKALPIEGSWAIDSLSCNLENGNSTGENTVGGVENVNIFAGKTTTCTFRNIFRSIKPGEGSGGRSGDPEDELKPAN